MLAAALAAVQQELPAIRKAETGEVSGTTKEGKAYRYTYSYADLAAVSAAIMPLLGKNGLAFTAWPTTVDGRLVLRYHLLHSSGERMDGEYPLPGGDRVTAQQLGSAITYARRYCLCAVTGVAPDDDDDAAAADGAKAQQRAEQQAEVDQELQHARNSVRGAWAVNFGPFDTQVDAVTDLYRKWGQGQKGTLTTATAGQLRAFAAYLSNLPPADAGTIPDDTAPAPQDDTTQQQQRPRDEKLSKPQRGKIFALFEDLGMKEDQRQLEYLTSVLERPIKSRSEVLSSDADRVIKALEADLAEARQTGLVPAGDQ
jgi:hypothetical protein